MLMRSSKPLGSSFLGIGLIATTLVLTSVPSRAVDVVIPDLGSSATSIITSQQEYELGQQVMKAYRAQLPTSSDPIIYSYLEKLISDLIQYSELEEKSFDLLVIENPTMNAFAVPGRVIGVHTGLFLTTETEDELASVITHELAHLSQRHYARRLEQQKNATLPTLAGILAGVVLAATAGGDAGMAAITATQAASLDSQLRFSRQYEQEADRIGIQTLEKAGRNPYAAGDMFEVMLRATRYTRKPPEFLLTHPVTESRIADARARALKYPEREYPDNLDFHLVSARVRLHNETTPQQAVKRFYSEIDGRSLNQEASRYGLVLALTEAGETEQARKELATLLEKRPHKEWYLIAQAKIDTKEKKYDSAVSLMSDLLYANPNDHALNINFAEILMEAGRYHQCEQLLNNFVKIRPKDDYAWYLLAEAHGLVGNILDVHLARAEYFVLVGVYDRALQQLDNALKLAHGDIRLTAIVREKIKDVQKMREDAEKI